MSSVDSLTAFPASYGPAFFSKIEFMWESNLQYYVIEVVVALMRCHMKQTAG
jgi:hypothetical protein